MAGTDHRLAIVTGASRGIGRETASLLAAKGYSVSLVARRGDRLETLAREIERSGGKAEAAPCDVSDREATGALVARLLDRHGGIALLVNNAGFGYHQRFVHTPPEVIRRMFEVNVLGAMALTQAVLPAFLARGAGAVVNVASVAGRVPHPLVVGYSASKHALVGFSLSLSLELRGTGVHVAVVCPGATQSEFWQSEKEELPYPSFIGRAATSPTPVARAILRASEGAGPIVYPTFGAALFAWVEKWIPWLSHRGNVWYRDRVLRSLESARANARAP